MADADSTLCRTPGRPTWLGPRGAADRADVRPADPFRAGRSVPRPVRFVHQSFHLAFALSALIASRSARAQERPDSSTYAIAGTDSATVARFVAQLQHA